MRRCGFVGMNAIFFPVLSFSILFSTYAQSQIYSWKDDLGVTHFSNRALDKDKSREVVTVTQPNRIEALSVGSNNSNVEKRSNKLMKRQVSSKRQLAAEKTAIDCDRVRSQRESLMVQLRKGYSLKEAKSLKSKKRRLSQILWEQCR